MKIKYKIFNPTGNITALVTSNVTIEQMPVIAGIIMENEPDVQQVGFIEKDIGCDILLTMAGGEFCGNATVCAAYICAENSNSETFNIKSSGTENSVTVKGKIKNGTFSGSVEMPEITEIKDVVYEYLNNKYTFPTVSLSGITHIVVENGEISKNTAEKAIIKWAKALKCNALGIMFLNKNESTLTPLVYVPKSETLFWESSCASGTTAAAVFLNKKYLLTDITLKQPAGSLRTTVNENTVKLFASAVFKTEKEMEITL